MNVLITGKNSYIGQCIKKHLESFGHKVDEVDTVSDEWKNADYSKYNSIVHVAAIVHSDAKSASEDLFRKVNTELPVEIARLAKDQGVKQFVFMSTMAVFGTEKSLNKDEVTVYEDAPLKPIGLYGETKLEAENSLQEFSDDSFKVSFVRPPNVYGHGCKGNYINLFGKLADLMFVCPYAYTEVRQSMIYIDNLCELIRLIIENNTDGVYMPQDSYAPNTVDLITIIRKNKGKKTRYSKILGKLIKCFDKLPLVNKIYGGTSYDMDMSHYFDDKYQIVSFEKGMEYTYKSKN